MIHRNGRRHAALLAGFSLAIGVFGMAGGCSSAPRGQAVSVSDVGGEWVLKQFDGRDVAMPATGRLPTLSISPDGKVGGFAGVNRVASSLDLGGLGRGEFKLSPAIATKMAGPPDAMELENEFLAALNKVRTSRLDKGDLVLGTGRSDLLRFVRPR